MYVGGGGGEEEEEDRGPLPTSTAYETCYKMCELILSFHDFISLEITELQADETFQGFTLENGKLKVQGCGLYYIYAQVFFEIYSSGPTLHNRVALTVNGNAFSLMQTGLRGTADYGSVFTGGIAHLHDGDYIGLKTAYPSSLWVSKAHTFFGACKIGNH